MLIYFLSSNSPRPSSAKRRKAKGFLSLRHGQNARASFPFLFFIHKLGLVGKNTTLFYIVAICIFVNI
jgi:hypothetical protein